MSFLFKLIGICLFALLAPAVGLFLLGPAPTLGWLLIAAPVLLGGYLVVTALA
jgi:hypothetical protein